jgi:hypothetical protein
MDAIFWIIFIFTGILVGYLGLLVLEIMAEDYPREF